MSGPICVYLNKYLDGMKTGCFKSFKIKGNRALLILFAMTFISICACNTALSAQGITNREFSENPNYAETKERKGTLLTLEAISKSIDTLMADLTKREGKFEYAQTADQRTKLSTEILRLNTQVKELQKDFVRIATGVEIETGTPEQKKRFDWQEEVQALFGPLLRELRGLTAHPREIEKLRTEIAYYQTRLPVIEKGIRHINELISVASSNELREDLNGLKRDWENQHQHLSNQLTIAEYHLNDKTRGRTSFLESSKRIIRIFFLSRGLNLIFSIMAFVFVWLFFNLVRRFIIKEYSIKRSRGRSFYSRLFNVVYHVLTFIVATLAMLVVLYVRGDWVLLVIALFFLFGIAWTARYTIPRYWEQGKLLLNLGPVKEHERVIYNGIAWEVSSLNFQSYLVNPLLMGGVIRLPLDELSRLISRPFNLDEPWFPCKEGDWVLLSDGTHGRVVRQTPEIVELVLLGGSKKSYSTAGFLKMNPENISTNFRIRVTFGVDYSHQEISTTTIPETLQKMLIEGLTKEGYEGYILELEVEFKEAGASSLDFEILADFSGKVAEDYFVLSRAIQRIAVEACNTYKWIIPFTQITVHTEGEKV